jgi:hypothetical protein
MKKRRKSVLVPVNLRVDGRGGTWTATFGPLSEWLATEQGDFNFSGAGKAVVVLTLQDSPGVQFLETGDLSIGFDERECPLTSDPKDKDVFRNIAVSDDRRSLSFTNSRKTKIADFFYAIFLRKGEDLIRIDPRIINR